jgi:hypothetical protein
MLAESACIALVSDPLYQGYMELTNQRGEPSTTQPESFYIVKLQCVCCIVQWSTFNYKKNGDVSWDLR